MDDLTQTETASGSTQQQTQQQSADANANTNSSQNSGAEQQAQQGESQAGAQTKAERPAWADEKFWDADAGTLREKEFADHIGEMRAAVAEQQSRQAAVPESPDGYKPMEEVDLGDGLTFKVEADDPQLQVWRQIAHASGLDQSGFEQGVKLYADSQKARMEAVNTLRAEQDTALGPKADERKQAVFDWIGGKYGSDAAELFKHTLVLSDQFEVMERVMRDASRGSVPGFNGSGREGGGPRIDEGAWEKASYTEQMRMLREGQGH